MIWIYSDSRARTLGYIEMPAAVVIDILKIAGFRLKNGAQQRWQRTETESMTTDVQRRLRQIHEETARLLGWP